MRPCPACNSIFRVIILGEYHNGWSMYQCSACEMLYLDKADETEESLNNYYKYIYQTDDKEYSDARLNDLAAAVASYIKPDAAAPYAPVMDIDCNKFTPKHLMILFERFCFNVIKSIPMADYREYHCWRMVARHG